MGAVVGFGLPLAGCGGGAGPAARDARASAAGDWRERANELCRSARSDAEDLGDVPETESGAVDYLQTVNARFHDFIRELRAIRVPEQVRAAYDRMTRNYERAVAAQEALVDALESSDHARAEREDGAITRWGDRGDSIALELSLHECALDPGESAPFENSQ